MTSHAAPPWDARYHHVAAADGKNLDAPVAYNPAMSWVTVDDAAALTFIMAMYWLDIADQYSS